MSIDIPANHCFHCGLPNPQSGVYSTKILSAQRDLCCPGCLAVASAIVENGLENYYEFRTETAAKGDFALDNTMAQLSVFDEPELQEEFVFDIGIHKQIQLSVEGISCAACGWLIEKQLARVAGLKQVSVNVGARRALITWDDTQIKLSGVLQKLKSIGYESSPFQVDKHESSYQNEQKRYLKRLGLAGLMTMQVMMLAMGQYFDLFGAIEHQTTQYFNWISLVLTTPVVLYSGSVFYLSALKAMQAKTINMDISVTIAIVSTYIAGIIAVYQEDGEVYFESICMFVFFLLISRFLEHRSRHKAAQISSNMLKYIPVTANVWVGNQIESVLAKQLKVGDLVFVKAGETVPIDGEITEGYAHIDESMITGEFEPVSKRQQQHVYGGTLNQDGQITIKVTRSLKHAMVNQILRLQESALASKPKVALVADELSRHFGTAVLSLSAITYIFWLWQGSPDAFWIGISILVATCPCALGLATPSALTCAMANLNKTGILIKRADVLEQLTHITDIVFDKTGTLTEGSFALQKVWVRDDNEIDELKAVQIAASLEQRSEHPIASAFKTETCLPLHSSQTFIGEGIQANIQDNLYRIGSASFVIANKDSQACLCSDMGMSNADQANVYLSENNVLVAAFLVSDSVKTDVRSVLSQLKNFNIAILSGDNQKNVESVASILNIKNTVFECTPQEKLTYITTAQNKGARILMVGDGINDAPVMSAASVSVAVGNASDLARNAADVILINAQLSSVLNAINMAARTKRKIKQNIIWALAYNVLILPIAMMGYLTPWMAALGMSLSSIIVVYNSTRLLR